MAVNEDETIPGASPNEAVSGMGPDEVCAILPVCLPSFRFVFVLQISQGGPGA